VVGRNPDFTPAHVILARLYYQLKRKNDAERERAIIQKLNEEQQKKQPVPGSQQPPLNSPPRPDGNGGSSPQYLKL